MNKTTVMMAAMLIMASFTMLLVTSMGDDTEGAGFSKDGLDYEVINMHDGVIDLKLVGPSNYAPAGGNFTVPSTCVDGGFIHRVIEIKESAFKGNSNIITLTIPDTVTKIGKGNEVGVDDNTGAFQNCTNLTTVTFTGGNVATFKHTFSGCTKLNSVDFNGVSSVGDAAFYKCTSLTNVQNTEGIKTIFGLGFYQCAFTEINLSGLTSLEGNSNFSESKIKSIDLPDAVKTIPYNAFRGCKDLVTVKMDGVTNIAYNAFTNSGVKSVSLKNVKVFGAGAFSGSKIESVDLSSATELGTSAFKNTNVANVTIPAGLTNISKNVFMECASLTSVVFEDGAAKKAIPESMFNGCSNLQSVVIPSCVTTIDAHAFRNCANLKSVVISEGVTDIDRNSQPSYGSFDGCGNLESVSMPDVHIGDNTFKGDTKLKNVTLIVGATSPVDGAIGKYFSKNWSDFTRSAGPVTMNITLVAADGVTSSDAWSKISASNPGAGSTVTDIDGVKYVYNNGKWAASKVPSTFVGGFEGSGFSVKITQTYDSNVQFPTESVGRIGYTHTGWVDESGNKMESTTIFTYGKPVVFTATWEAIQYTVDFVCDGTTLESKTGTIGNTVSFSKTGYNNASKAIDATAIGGITGTTFAVEVTKITYTVNFVCNGTTLESKTGTIGETVTFSKTGYNNASKTIDATAIESASGTTIAVDVTKITYTVDFVCDGTTLESKTGTIGETVTFSKTGYNNASKTIDATAIESASGTTFAVDVTKITYTVNFVCGETTLESKTGTIDETIAFSKVGYNAASKTIDAAVIESASGTTFTVDVTKITYTVNFVCDGTTLESKTGTIGETVTFSKTGYNNASKTIDATAIESASGTTFAVDVTKITYTVNFVCGETTLESKTGTIDETIAFSKVGYNAASKTIDAAVIESASGTTFTVDVTKITYTVNFVCDGTTLESKTGTIGETVTFSKTGYNNASKTIDAAAIESASGTTFTVDVTKIVYTVNFVCNGTTLATETGTIDETPAFSKAGYNDAYKIIDAAAIEAMTEATFTVEVTMIPYVLNITATNASVDGVKDGDGINCGSDISFTVKINKRCKDLSVNVTIGGEPFQVSADADGKYTIPAQNVLGDVVLTVSATPIPAKPITPVTPAPETETYKVAAIFDSKYVEVSGTPSGDIAKGASISVSVKASSVPARITVTVEMGGVPVGDAFSYTDGEFSGTVFIGDVTGDVTIKVAHEHVEADTPVTVTEGISWAIVIAALSVIVIAALLVVGRKKRSAA